MMQPWDGWFDVLFWFRGFVFCPSFVFPTNSCLTGSLAGITPCSFALPHHGFVINLILSGRSAGNMPLRGLKPHVGELDLGICCILSPFDLLNWKATEISSFSLSLEFCVIFQHLLLKPLGHAFSLGVSACSWRKSVFSLASSSSHWALELPTAHAMWMLHKKWNVANVFSMIVMAEIVVGAIGDSIQCSGHQWTG